MITNREQHELAAKAAGLAITWKTGSCKGGEVEAAFVGDQPWRPRDDDGDALRLAVKLGMDVCVDTRHEPGPSTHVVCFSNDYDSAIVDEMESHNDCPLAATRLAIFRAAVEIGRGMP